MNINKLFAALLLLISAGSFAQQNSGSNSAFSLKEAQEYAVKNNTSTKNAEIDQHIAKAKKNETVGIGLPQISGNFDLKDFEKLPTSLLPAQFFGGPPGTFIPISFGTRFNATGTVQASQIIFNSDYLVGLQASQAYLELSEKAYQRTRIEVMVAVSKAYYNVLINRERIKLLDANINRLKKLKEDTKVLNENGFVEKIDLDRIEVTFNNLVTEKQKIEKLMGLGEVLLKFQMGYDVAQPIQLKDSLNLNETVSESPELGKINYSNRVEYSLLESQLKLNQLDLKRNRLGYLPTIVAFGSYSEQAQRNKFDLLDTKQKWYPIGVIGGTLSLPIFDGLQKNYRIQQAKLNVMKTKNTMQNIEQAITLEATSAIVNYQNAITSLNTQKRNMELAGEVYRVSKAKYDQGVGSNLEVITAETSIKEAQTNYFSALYDYYVAKTDYDKAVGNIK